MKDNFTTTHEDGADPWVDFNFQMLAPRRAVLGSTQKRWRVARIRHKKSNRLGFLAFRKHTKNRAGWHESGTGKTTGWDFLAFRKHTKIRSWVT